MASGNLLQDVHQTVRILARNAGFSAVVVATLAVGIGANSAIFSILNVLLLRPMPYKEPDRLVHLWETDQQQGWNQLYVSVPNFVDWQKQNRSFEQLGAFLPRELNLPGEPEPERIQTARITANIFDLLGVRPELGRTLKPEEDRPGVEGAAVISHRFWKRRFGGTPAVLGQKFVLDDQPYTVVGVMPPSFIFPQPTTDIWIPLAFDASRETRESRLLQVVGRLKPGVSSRQAQAEMSAIAKRLVDQYSVPAAASGVNIVPLRKALTFSYDIVRLVALILLLAVTFVLLIACANVANLLLIRAVARAREMAVYSALGANRWRLIRLFLVESTALALLGGAVGLLIAHWAIKLITPTIPDDVYRVGEYGISVEVALYTLAISLLTALLVGLIPGLRFTRFSLTDVLKEGSGSATTGRRGRHAQSALVVAEIALAVILLNAALLMVLSSLELQRVHPGFQSEGVLTAKLTLSETKYEEKPKRTLVFQELLDRLAGVPGVKSVAVVNFLPLNHETRWREFDIEGKADSAGERPSTIELVVSPDYFKVLGIPLLRGRVFASRDDHGAQPVAIVNRTLAERYWPGKDPVGSRIRFGKRNSDTPWVTIVGVVADAKHTELSDPPQPLAYVPLLQEPWAYTRLLVKAEDGDPARLAPAVKKIVWSVDPGLPVTEIRTMDQVIADSLTPLRVVSRLLAALAAGGFLIAAVGIYGVMAFTVSRRVQEIGIRIALGAERQRILRLVLGKGVRLAGLGLIIGFAGAAGMTQALRSMLYGVRPTDPSILLGTALSLAAVAVLASLIPAQRASRIDPAVALRYE